jgi:hypothetical protein
MRSTDRINGFRRSFALIALGLIGAVLPALQAFGQGGGANPTVYPLRWFRPGGAADETTDTPAAAAFTKAVSKTAGGGAQVSVVASPAPGSEAVPGASLNVTAAAQHNKALRFRFILVTGTGDVTLGTVNGINPERDNKYWTAKLSAALLTDVPVHSLKVRVEEIGGTRFAETATVQVLDPRAQLRAELGAELARLGIDPGTADPISVFQQVMGGLINVAETDSGLGALATDVRGGEWAKGSTGMPLTDAQEMRGEFYSLLLNFAAIPGFNPSLEREDHANLAVPLDVVVPPIYLAPELQAGKVPGVDFIFPRLDGGNVEEFPVPDQLYGFQAERMLREWADKSLGPPLTGLPPGFEQRTYENLADTGRLFNAQTAVLFRGGIRLGSRYRPDMPRARVYADVKDGTTVPAVAWGYSHPDPRQATQARVRITLDAALLVDANDARGTQSLPGLTPGLHTLVIEVFDGLGFSNQRTLQFRAP